MRGFGLILILIGALTLGFQGVTAGGPPDLTPSAEARTTPGERAWVSPVVGGIAMVGGLLLIASGARRE